MLPRSKTARNQRTKDKDARCPRDNQFPNVERPNGTRVNIPNRDPCLPHFYLVKSHAQVQKEWKAQRIFVYLQDSSAPAMEDHYKFMRKMKFPEGTKRGIAKAGFLYLRRGDYVFCRDVNSERNDETDVLQLWIPSDGVFSEELIARMKEARDLGLGPREERTPFKAKKQNRVWQGGVKHERSKRAMNVRNAPRCYSLVQSYQVQKNMTTPAASTKITMGEQPCEHMLDREKIIHAVTRVAIRSMEVAPESISNALKLQAEVTNLPPVGFEGNYAFPALQANFAAAQTADSLAGSRLKEEFGSFGGKHLDHNDSEGGYTSMVTYSDVADDEDSGVFIVGDLGVAIALDGFIVINFCGLRFHGGYPPTAAPGKTPKRWSYRFSAVCYPPRPMLDSSTRLGFAVLPGDHLFVMPPEFTDPRYDDTPVVTNLANWISSGLYLTSPAAFMKFYYRTFCQMAHHFGRQAPRGSTISVDYKKLSECFKLTEEDGTEHQPEFWELHPGSEAKSAQFQCTRKESVKLWEKHKEHHGKLMPSVVHAQHLAAAKSNAVKTAVPQTTKPATKRKNIDSQTARASKRQKTTVDQPEPGPSRTTSKRKHVEADGDDYSADDEGQTSKSAARPRKKGKAAVLPIAPSARPIEESGAAQTELGRSRRSKGAGSKPSKAAASRYQLRFPHFADGSDPDLTSVCASNNRVLLKYLGQRCEYEDSSSDEDEDDDDWNDPIDKVHVAPEDDQEGDDQPGLSNPILNEGSDDDADDEARNHGGYPGDAHGRSESNEDSTHEDDLQFDSDRRLFNFNDDPDQPILSEELQRTELQPRGPPDLSQSSKGTTQDAYQEEQDVSSTPERDEVGALSAAQPLMSGSFDKVLKLFSLSFLQQELERFRKMERRILQSPEACSSTPAPLNDFVKAFSGDQLSPSFTRSIALMWPNYEAQKTTADLADLQLAAHRRRLMLCNAAAWYWLTESCARRCQAIVRRLGEDASAYDDSDHWLERLCSRVYKAVQERRREVFKVADFIPNLPLATEAVCAEGVVSRPVKLEEDFSSRVCSNVIALLRAWLAFPNNTEMLAAYFVLHLMCTFKNSDVLLLDGVWRVYRSVKSSVLGYKTKAASVRVEMLTPFATALQALPLAQNESEEAYTLHVLSETVDRCLPGVKAWTESLVQAVNAADLLTDAPAPGPPLIPPSNARALTSIPAPIPSLGTSLQSQEHGLKQLTDFVLHLLPVGLGQEIDGPTPLQMSTRDRPDFYLPFRELAPCRRRVTGEGGPYHLELNSEPGAFASWCIFRALIYDSDVIHNHTTGYFRDHAAWEAFLTAQEYDETNMESVDRFFNIGCYGSKQRQRRDGREHAPKYFETEVEWNKLLEEHRENGVQKPVPFKKFYLWLQGKKEVPRDDPAAKPKYTTIPNIKLPLLGNLTAYLVAADVSYTDKVSSPSIADMAFAIHRIGKGAYNGLKALKLLSNEKKHTCREVEVAFERVYSHLSANIPQEYHSQILLDGIMTEHTLCKFVRTRKIRQ